MSTRVMTHVSTRTDVDLCQRCEHPASWHRHDDADNIPATDPACAFRCLGYDCEKSHGYPKGGRACDCPDFVRHPEGGESRS